MRINAMTISRRSALALLASVFMTATVAASPAERRPFDQKAFADALAAGQPVLVHITASWCTICEVQKNILSILDGRPQFAGMVGFDVDYDTQKDIMRSFRATDRSTLIVYKQGVEVGRVVGETRPSALEALLTKAI
jgi:thiol:disulfide interchange protein